MPAIAGRELTADRAIAVLLLSIDQELAARVLRNMHDDHLDRITRAMKELAEVAIDQRTIGAVYGDARKRLQSGVVALGDVQSSMDSVLSKAFGQQRGADVSARASTEILAKRPFAMFESLTPEDLANLLTEEHPQIAAVFIAHLDRQKAGRVVVHLEEDRRADIIFRVATLDRTPPEVVQRVLDVMRKKVKDLGLTTLRSEPRAWVKAAAEILNNMGGGDKSILDAVGERDERIMAGIRDQMFTFDDLARIDRKGIQKVLGQIDTRVLALALKATTPEVEQNVFGNLSKRAADMVAEERDSLGPTPLSEVLEAQQQILRMIRDLIDKGEIHAGAGAQEQLV